MRGKVVRLAVLGMVFAACGEDAAPASNTEAPDVPIADFGSVEIGPSSIDNGATPSDSAIRPACAPGDGCFLDQCSENGDCQSGWCIDHLGDPICTTACFDECPPGFACTAVTGTGTDVTWICLSNATHLCRPCTSASDCASATGAEDVCVDYGPQGSFCGAPCASSAHCPWGFSCRDSKTVAGIPTKQCTADAGVCPCAQKSVALALHTSCAVVNDLGSCNGTRYCSEEGLTECDATTPSAEVCDAVDNDCDGQADEGTCDDGNPCTTDTCDGVAGCLHAPVDGSACDDGDECTTGDHCSAGTCAGSAVLCDDGNPCTDDACDAAGDCDSAWNASPCDDGDPCTVADQCSSGSCGGVALPCECVFDGDCAEFEDSNLCNGTLVCDTSALPYKCVTKPESIVTCVDPPSPCEAATCDAVTGECVVQPANGGFACDDADACTLGEKCADGDCVQGTAINCLDDNPCTNDACDTTNGCVHVPIAAPCFDGDLCTGPDVCADGGCSPGPEVPCDDGNACTSDGCNAGTGCTFDKIPGCGECETAADCPSKLCVAGKCLEPSGVLEGNYTVYNTIDLAIVSGVEIVDGNLTIFGPPEVQLPALKAVTGDLIVHGGAPNIVETLSLPALTAVGGDMRIKATPLLTGIELPLLASVAGKVELMETANLVAADFGALEGHARIWVTNNQKLATVDLSGLVNARKIRLAYNPTLVNVVANGLVSLSATEGGGGGDLEVFDNAVLGFLSLPALETVTDTFSFADNPKLAGWHFPALTHVGGEFSVNDNPLLPQCLVDDLLQQVAFEGPTLAVSGQSTSCP